MSATCKLCGRSFGNESIAANPGEKADSAHHYCPAYTPGKAAKDQESNRAAKADAVTAIDPRMEALPGAGDEFGVVVHAFWKNKGEQIRISLNEYKGYDYIDVRSFVPFKDGLRPSRRGVTIRKDQFPELFRGVLQLGDALGYGADELLTWLNKAEGTP